jgi:hypothetical protein
MTGVRLTEQERDRLCDAVVDYTANRANSAPDRFDKYLLPAVERILADRLAAHEEREARVRTLAERWVDVLVECKAADPCWILDRSVTTLETALTELRAALKDD